MRCFKATVVNLESILVQLLNCLLSSKITACGCHSALRNDEADDSKALSRMQSIVVEATEKHTASLIFLHGLGGSGKAQRDWLKAIIGKDLMFRNIRIVYPTAPLRPILANGGEMSRSWCNFYKISPSAPEHRETLEESCKAIGTLIEKEELLGIPRTRIILGGFSIGAIMACYYGYQYGRTLAGIFALAGSLPHVSDVYETLRENPGKTPQLYQSHGEMDDVIRIEWGKMTSEKLALLGVNTSFHSYPIAHEMTWSQIDAWAKWVKETLPDS